ncbi:MAG: hypothetical protein ACLQAH_00480 [Limisphaerales bacterium]
MASIRPFHEQPARKNSVLGCFIALITTSYTFISRMILCGGQFVTGFGLPKVVVGELQDAGIWPLGVSSISALDPASMLLQRTRRSPKPAIRHGSFIAENARIHHK